MKQIKKNELDDFLFCFKEKKKLFIKFERQQLEYWINGEMGQYDKWQTAPYWDEL